MSVEGIIAKPRLRGLLRRRLQFHLTMAGLLSTSAAAAWWFLVALPRRKRYADFYKTYDAQADFERMKRLGLFQSCPIEKK